MIPYLTCIKIRVELMLLYYKANENHTINVLVLVGILNAPLYFSPCWYFERALSIRVAHKALLADYISRSTKICAPSAT